MYAAPVINVGGAPPVSTPGAAVEFLVAGQRVRKAHLRVRFER